MKIAVVFASTNSGQYPFFVKMTKYSFLLKWSLQHLENVHMGNEYKD